MLNSSSQNKKVAQNAVILVDKPTGMTSFGVVARLRRQLSQQLGRRAKVGHAGTLDPFATGLLIILTGDKCRVAQDFLKLDKSYEATLVLGWTTPTLDPEGRLTLIGRAQPSQKQIASVLRSFLGETKQVPPNFSAIKVAGRRAYDLARQGRELKLPARTITISQLDILGYNYPFLTLNIAVSSGTYIRALARDIGEKLGTGAYCASLRRTRIDKYQIKEAKQLSDLLDEE